MNAYYLYHTDQVIGPFSEVEITAQFRQEALLPDTPICGSDATWKRLADVFPSLFDKPEPPCFPSTYQHTDAIDDLAEPEAVRPFCENDVKVPQPLKDTAPERQGFINRLSARSLLATIASLVIVFIAAITRSPNALDRNGVSVSGFVALFGETIGRLLASALAALILSLTIAGILAAFKKPFRKSLLQCYSITVLIAASFGLLTSIIARNTPPQVTHSQQSESISVLTAGSDNLATIPNGNMKTFNTVDNPNVKDIKVSLPYPDTWISKPGYRPQVIQVFQGTNSDANVTLELIVKDFPGVDLSLYSDSEIQDALMSAEAQKKYAARGKKIVAFDIRHAKTNRTAIFASHTFGTIGDIRFAEASMEAMIIYKFKQIGINLKAVGEPNDIRSLDAQISSLAPLFFSIVDGTDISVK
jgi:hypothetical protein